MTKELKIQQISNLLLVLFLLRSHGRKQSSSLYRCLILFVLLQIQLIIDLVIKALPQTADVCKETISAFLMSLIPNFFFPNQPMEKAFLFLL